MMKRILCIGDSNTFGHDPRSYGGARYPREVRWTGRLERPDRQVLNHGHNGACIPRGGELADAAALIEESAPDMTVIMLGTNDLLRGASAVETAERMEVMLAFIKEHAGNPRLLLVAPPPMVRGEWVPTDALAAESGKLADLYRAAAERYGAAFADAGLWGVELIFDGVHFSPEGHGAFARGLSAVLDALE